MDRRAYLKLGGAGALGTLVGGAGIFISSEFEFGSADNNSQKSEKSTENSPQEPERISDRNGPPNPGQWTLAFEDLFDSGMLDRSTWGIGWGWGRQTSTSPTQIVPRNVSVANEALRLKGTHSNGTVFSGAVNTKDSVTFGPGTYFEARLKFAQRTGFQNAFWSKPNSEAWPPEIDVTELIQDGSGWDDIHVSRHNLHYSSSTNPGDDSTYENIDTMHVPGNDLTKEFHTYGVEWQPNSLSHFVDGQKIWEWTDPTMLRSMRRGAPFYLLLSLNINNVGTASLNVPWGEEFLTDWLRLWRHVPSDSNSTTRR